MSDLFLLKPKNLKSALSLKALLEHCLWLQSGVDLFSQLHRFSHQNQKIQFLNLSELKELKKIQTKEQFLSISTGITIEQLLEQFDPCWPKILKWILPQLVPSTLWTTACLSGQLLPHRPLDLYPILLLLEAKIEVISEKKNWLIPIQQWERFVLEKEQLISQIHIPLPNQQTYYFLEKKGNPYFQKHHFLFAGSIEYDLHGLNKAKFIFFIDHQIYTYKELDFFICIEEKPLNYRLINSLLNKMSKDLIKKNISPKMASTIIRYTHFFLSQF